MATNYLNFDDVLKELDLTETELHKMISDGELVAFKDPDNKLRFLKADIDQLRRTKPKSEYFSVDQVLQELKLEQNHLDEMISDGAIRAFRDPHKGTIRFKKEDIDLLKTSLSPKSKPLPRESPQPVKSPPPSPPSSRRDLTFELRVPKKAESSPPSPSQAKKPLSPAASPSPKPLEKPPAKKEEESLTLLGEELVVEQPPPQVSPKPAKAPESKPAPTGKKEKEDLALDDLTVAAPEEDEFKIADADPALQEESPVAQASVASEEEEAIDLQEDSSERALAELTQEQMQSTGLAPEEMAQQEVSPSVRRRSAYQRPHEEKEKVSLLPFVTLLVAALMLGLAGFLWIDSMNVLRAPGQTPSDFSKGLAQEVIHVFGLDSEVHLDQALSPSLPALPPSRFTEKPPRDKQFPLSKKNPKKISSPTSLKKERKPPP